MNQTINITVSQGGIVNIYNNPTPYRTVKDNNGMLHTFYTKEEYEEFTSIKLEQK